VIVRLFVESLLNRSQCVAPVEVYLRWARGLLRCSHARNVDLKVGGEAENPPHARHIISDPEPRRAKPSAQHPRRTSFFAKQCDRGKRFCPMPHLKVWRNRSSNRLLLAHVAAIRQLSKCQLTSASSSTPAKVAARNLSRSPTTVACFVPTAQYRVRLSKRRAPPRDRRRRDWRWIGVPGVGFGNRQSTAGIEQGGHCVLGGVRVTNGVHLGARPVTTKLASRRDMSVERGSSNT
jgi:hypothetical protein